MKWVKQGLCPSHPCQSKKDPSVSDEVNERSLVMKLSFGRRTFLLPGGYHGNLRIALG